ncbi:unnamed protein product [Staurois parvus]|uniref:Uncharacterized protein n=1 Tax=Staurois parvus TaxID=386267 RepID=A0ABN9BRA0_9NEOB|nr:unnamed protein product [Staurois parvus]
MLSLVCIAREVFFLSWESASAQGQSALSRQMSGVLHPPRAERNRFLQALSSALLNTEDCSKF